MGEDKGAAGVRNLLNQGKESHQSKDNYNVENKSDDDEHSDDCEVHKDTDETDSCHPYKNQNDKRFGFKQQIDTDKIDIRIIPAQFHRFVSSLKLYGF